MATTLKLPPELKERISRVVEGTGQTAHAFMVDAIRSQTERAEKRREFTAAALAAREEFGRSGIGYAMEDMHAYMKARAAGKKARKPKPRRWRA
jgi:predicted transcriptional regulator